MILTLLLGSNLGDKLQNLQQATQLINQNIGQIIEKSAVYETAPWGYTQQPNFYNQVINVATNLEPLLILKNTQQIEQAMGRVKHTLWAERIIDIDILYYENLIFNTPTLIIPHPALTERRFTLVPLCEIMPHFLHPILKQNQQILLANCPDNLPVTLVVK